MKKIIYLLTAALVASLLTVSCGKDDGDGGKKTVQKRIATFGYNSPWGEHEYKFTYDANGKIIRIQYGEPSIAEPSDWEEDWTVTYSGNQVTFTNEIEGDDHHDYSLTLGANGYASRFIDGWGDNFVYTYDAAGHLTNVTKDADPDVNKSDITITAGNIAKWTRYSDGVLQTKDHTYLDALNKGKIHHIHSEASEPSQMFYEAGFFGLPPVDLCESNKWQHSETTATFTYDVDDDGYVIDAIKNYGGDLEHYTYTWEVIE